MADDGTMIWAQEAYARQDWHAAATSFAAAGPDEMTADDLATYADTEFWLGHMDDTLRLGAAAYGAFLEESRSEGAAMAGVLLGIFHMAMGDELQAMGWIGRAGRLAQDIPECVVHGYLMFLTEVEANLKFGRPSEAVTAARRMQDLGRRLNHPDLVAMGVHAEGRALLKSGDAATGLALIDEAMVSVLDRRLSPLNQWTLYCFTIDACHEVADLRRMSRWTELTEQWLASLPDALGPGFGGMCGVHRAQLHLLRGAWEEAERAALPAAQLDSVRVPYCWPRAMPRRRSPYSATPAAAGMRWVRGTTLPVPAAYSLRHTARSVTRSPQPRRPRWRRQPSNGWAGTARHRRRRTD